MSDNPISKLLKALRATSDEDPFRESGEARPSNVLRRRPSVRPHGVGVLAPSRTGSRNPTAHCDLGDLGPQQILDPNRQVPDLFR